ncbi:hypothetical protein ACFHWW_34160, partial [Ensifer sp. P24N7]|uniref:hypothetical protein n=1 Tax=Sinorhizobium sp. P24N7 TaxID=3348358 RepID=UPI0035F4A3C8
VYNHESRAAEAIPVYDLNTMGDGAAVDGPCIVDAPTFTAYLKPNHNGEVDRYGNLVVTVA